MRSLAPELEMAAIQWTLIRPHNKPGTLNPQDERATVARKKATLDPAQVPNFPARQRVIVRFRSSRLRSPVV